MLRLVYSNRTEELLAELAIRVRDQQAGQGALVPVRIVVPSSSVEAYIRIGIATACGIAANLDTALLTRFASELVLATCGTLVADAAAIEAMVLALLLDEATLAAPELAPVGAYLRAAGDTPDAIDIRRVQLAGRLGRLFEEYTFARGDMLSAWRNGTTLDPLHAETERWQRHLWLAMFGEGGIAMRDAPGAPRLRPLSDVVSELNPARGTLPEGVHVFGFSHLARSFYELLQRIAKVTELVVYALSPCEGFWEDVDARDPAPLHLWGRPGREHVRALNAIAGFDHDDRFVDPVERDPSAPATLLHRLQSDVLRREPARDLRDDADDPRDRRPEPAPDESIVVLEHASVRRELEAVASEIWRLVASDATLRFDEVAVLVPDSDARIYAAHLPAVLREANDLPHQVVAAPLTGSSRLAEAIDLLFALPLGRFTRQELLRLAVHPTVVASMDNVDPRRWVSWCDALGVVHGADRDDHADTYIERDILNWDQGLRRLALGAFMVGDASGERRPFELAGEAYVPHEVSASEQRDAAAFGVLLRSLLADARFARAAELTMREWAAFLRAMVESYIAPSRGEEDHFARCLRRLHTIGEIDIGARRVRYRIACELARARIAELSPGHGAEGVVVSTLASLRPLPFRVVFACGMGEGRFPSPEAQDPLDLRWARRREGDMTAREGDKYAFLELLLGARDRLYLSYVSRDPLTGDTLAPSSVVQELLHALSRGYVRSPRSLRRRHPLRRWDPVYFPALFASGSRDAPALGTMSLPEACAEARTLALRRGLESLGERVDQDGVQARAAEDPAWAALAAHLGLALLPQAPPSAQPRVVVPMHAIVKFLEFPLQGWARLRLGLEEMEDDDAMAREDEPFETDLREETLLLRQVVLDAAAKNLSLEQSYDEVVRDRELRGLGPSGVFAEGERGDHLETLATWRAALDALDLPIGTVEVHRFGRAGEHARADRVHGPLVIDVDVIDGAGVMRVVKAEIAGRSLPLGAGGGASLTLFRRTKEKDDDWALAGRERSALRAFLDHTVFSASGVREGEAHASVVVVATPEGPVTERVSFAAMTRDEATAWLRAIVRELMGRPHAYFLPCEAVFVRHRRDPQGPVARWLELARAQLADSDGPLALRSAYGPVPRPERYPAPDEATAKAMIERRFGVFFEKQEATR